jgi:hypothetical protein
VSVGFDLRVLEGLGHAWWCVDTAAGLVASSMRELGLGACGARVQGCEGLGHAWLEGCLLLFKEWLAA